MTKRAPADRRYSEDHEWAMDNGDGTATVGITDFAQDMLTDVVFVELPPLGKRVESGQTLAIVESVKSVSDVYTPVGGEVVEVNGVLEDHPELINQDAFGAGWLVRLRMNNPDEMRALMDGDAYEAFLGRKDAAPA
jgi:glycine cleavage system H protein